MRAYHRISFVFLLAFSFIIIPVLVSGQDLPPRYATLELFTNTPCPICANQNPGLFSRLANFEGEYHLIGFYPGKPYSSCIFYQANKPENDTRYQFYQGNIFGTPTVALNGIDFKSSNGVTNTVLEGLTGGTSWLHVDVEETTGNNRSVTIHLEDHVGGSLATGRLFAVIVEKEIEYSAPNGETLHHNVFRKFLTDPSGEEIDLSSGFVTKSYDYDVDPNWKADEVYVIAWVSDPATKEVFNSGTRFDPDFTSSVDPVSSKQSLTIYPNPATAEVYVKIPEGVTTADIYILDFQGRMIHSLKTYSTDDVLIPITTFPFGSYLIQLKAGNTMYSGSFSIKP
jgi:hypothetical protein